MTDDNPRIVYAVCPECGEETAPMIEGSRYSIHHYPGGGHSLVIVPFGSPALIGARP
ncbi:hypothetical protein SEA_KOZIE_9 [Microbacterium phage Kozie]|uniref:Uncharacterized protein n=1 Tax=Microbacterium phage Kozie TaxID=2885981 RepID=A0AAE8Y7P0_9CAUD|nr:hypothetical protein QC998_gp09 [Microbacterium phage Kozie]UDL16205.1 hypothetical protein SEA_KOZIE_9 [Microbacterium phage Kozie]